MSAKFGATFGNLDGEQPNDAEMFDWIAVN